MKLPYLEFSRRALLERKALRPRDVAYLARVNILVVYRAIRYEQLKAQQDHSGGYWILTSEAQRWVETQASARAS